jgi:hypothetical protein
MQWSARLWIMVATGSTRSWRGDGGKGGNQ